MKPSAPQAGSTYLEALVSIALLGMALMISAGFLLRGRAHLRQLELRGRALLALETEMAYVRGAGGDLPGPGAHEWISGAVGESGLPGAEGRLEIAPGPLPGLVSVRLRLEWNDAPAMTREILLPRAP